MICGLARQRWQLERILPHARVGDMIEQMTNQIEAATALIVEVNDVPGGVLRVSGFEHEVAGAAVLDVLLACLEVDR